MLKLTNLSILTIFVKQRTYTKHLTILHEHLTILPGHLKMDWKGLMAVLQAVVIQT